ncbi:MAG TPA: protein kinase [Candidatus Eisenbacteria bacterium]|nr:protein kinase [Candidatus Eisenbacteria bacterium]
MPLAPNTRLGTYEILGPLGTGGMGEVYRARDLRLGREVAVKVLPAEVASRPDRLARFEREARTVAGLNHPNIVTLYSVEEEDGVRFLTMELVVGRPLSSLVVPGGLPVAQIVDFGIAITRALVAAQGKGVIHRDLKPGNVMVADDGRVKVLDFGLAKVAEEVDPPSGPVAETTLADPLTVEGALLGTVPYMAPEQLRGDRVDARCDLFALGIILYELTAGRRPFGGRTHADVTSSILRDSPEPLSLIRPDLPRGLERVVEHCLEKDPARRPASALELAETLATLDLAPEPVRTDAPRPGTAPSIAVLPFVNRSRDEEDEYFSDGLADELLGMLAGIPNLHVAARTSSFQFKGTRDDVATIGRKLRVATLLEGSVRRSGNRARITVQLVEVANGYHIWSETYDRTLDDIFAVQDDIAQSVVKELRAALLGAEAGSSELVRVREDVANAARGRAANPEAHRLYLLARHCIDRWTQEDMVKGIGRLKEALALDPDFAVGWAELSRAHTVEAACGWAPVAEGNERAREAAERALALRPDLPDGYVRLGWIQMTYDWDWPAALASLKRAEELAPQDDRVLHMLGILARNVGRLEDAIELDHRALARDPLSSATYLNLGLNLYAAGRAEEAEAAFRQSLEFASEGTVAHAGLALSLAAQGRTREALTEARREPEELVRLYALAILHATSGDTEHADEALRDLIQRHAEHAPTQIAEVCSVRGEKDRAFDWLERAHAERDGGLTEIKASPHLRALHEDPRWGDFLRRMGFDA